MPPDWCVSINRWKYVPRLMSNIRALLILFHQTPKPTHFLPRILFSSTFISELGDGMTTCLSNILQKQQWLQLIFASHFTEESMYQITAELPADEKIYYVYNIVLLVRSQLNCAMTVQSNCFYLAGSITLIC